MVRVSLDRPAEPSVEQTVNGVKGEDKKLYRKKVLLRKFTIQASSFKSTTYLVEFSGYGLWGTTR
jgi:hypothetical protein